MLIMNAAKKHKYFTGLCICVNMLMVLYKSINVDA